MPAESRSRRSPWLLAGLLWAAGTVPLPAVAGAYEAPAAAGAASAEAPAALKVGEITFDRGPVFDPSRPGESSWLFRAANALHVTTQESVLRRELLFKEGDPYDPALLQETERNLRRFRFLRYVRVRASRPHDGVVDVRVVTADAWTTVPEVSFSRTGSGNNVAAGFLERDVLGLGKEAEVSYGQGFDGVQRQFSYRDPQFAGGHVDMGLEHLVLPSATQTSGSISRPFYSTLTPYTLGVSGDYITSELPLYSGGSQVGSYRDMRRDLRAFFGLSLAAASRRTRRLTAAYSYAQSRSRPASPGVAGLVPSDSRLGALTLSFDWQDILYMQQQRIQKFDRVEDVNLGLGFSAGLGLAPRWLGSSEATLLPQASVRMGWRWGPAFALLSTGYSQRLGFDGQTSERLGSLDLQAYSRGLPGQTVAAHVGYTHGYRLDTDRLMLGENAGLRGYANNQFMGNRLLIASLEDRVFLARDVLHVVSFGAAAFFDAGYAWPSGVVMRTQDLRSAVGFGFRCAPSRSTENEVVRIDLAYALSPNRQASRWVLSLVTGYTFGF